MHLDAYLNEFTAELALTMAAAAGREFDLPFAHAMAAYPRAARGELAEARAHVQAALGGARSSGVVGALQFAAAAAAALAQAEGDSAALVAAAGWHRDAPELGIFPIGPLQAEAMLAQGRLDDAQSALRAYERDAAAAERRSVQLSAARVRVTLEAALGDLGAARSAFESGRSYAAGLGRPLEEGRLALAFGDALARFKHRREARTALSEAAAIFASIGADQYLSHAQRALEALGGARGRARSTGEWPERTGVSRRRASGLRPDEQAGRGAAVHQPKDGRVPPRQCVRQARRVLAHTPRRAPGGRATRAATSRAAGAPRATRHVSETSLDSHVRFGG